MRLICVVIAVDLVHLVIGFPYDFLELLHGGFMMVPFFNLLLQS